MLFRQKCTSPMNTLLLSMFLITLKRQSSLQALRYVVYSISNLSYFSNKLALNTVMNHMWHKIFDYFSTGLSRYQTSIFPCMKRSETWEPVQ